MVLQAKARGKFDKSVKFRQNAQSKVSYRRQKQRASAEKYNRKSRFAQIFPFLYC